jgi:hypothetical protein
MGFVGSRGNEISEIGILINCNMGDPERQGM